MGTTKLKEYLKLPSLTIDDFDDLFREGLGQQLDGRLEDSLDKNAELIISRKIKEETEDNLELIFK